MTSKLFSRTDNRKAVQWLNLRATAFLGSHATIELDAANIVATPAACNALPGLSAVTLLPTEGNIAALPICFYAEWSMMGAAMGELNL